MNTQVTILASPVTETPSEVSESRAWGYQSRSSSVAVALCSEFQRNGRVCLRRGHPDTTKFHWGEMSKNVAKVIRGLHRLRSLWQISADSLGRWRGHHTEGEGYFILLFPLPNCRQYPMGFSHPRLVGTHCRLVQTAVGMLTSEEDNWPGSLRYFKNNGLPTVHYCYRGEKRELGTSLPNSCTTPG